MRYWQGLLVTVLEGPIAADLKGPLTVVFSSLLLSIFFAVVVVDDDK